ncbi:hypothetical protein [Coleofasciculus sp. FACHB-T130]|uniref:hypothetical protein n=1 Tax=Cyanophyceae TaxID=3028117 RepID=UPI001689760E|nr:hypothetical protein [Coleofasciculus sp. FACHB-T130]MBD1878196.1 hypothetical protein [Coleofasciculus sp. FACHB-T130]
MKVFRDLKLTGQPETLQEVIQKIEKILDNGWYKDTQAEAELNSRQVYDLTMYCFSCSETEARRASSLWFGDPQYGKLSVSNIVPQKVSELSYDEYNHILEEFFNRFVVPALKGMEEVIIDWTDPEFDLEESASPEGAFFLLKFSEAANKSTAASHPMDEERWYAFLVAAHKNNAALDSSNLVRWLREEGGWSEDIAFKLAAQYESARSLLNYYDRSK